MNVRRIREKDKGKIFSLLSDSYFDSPLYSGEYIESWREFDEFVFSNFELTNNHIILSLEKNEVIGFIRLQKKYCVPRRQTLAAARPDRALRPGAGHRESTSLDKAVNPVYSYPVP